MSDLTMEQVDYKRVYAATGFGITVKSRNRTEMERKMVNTWGDGMNTWKPGHCKICNCELEKLEGIDLGDYGMNFDYPDICNDCDPLVDNHFDGENTSSNVDMTPVWHEKCPRLYQEIVDYFNHDNTRINILAYKEVTSWRYDKQGMYIHGESGRGKSAALWGLFKEIERETTRHPYIVKSNDLARILGRSAKDMASLHDHWLIRCGVLMIDDLGKEKITASFASQIFDVINARYEQYRPTIITTKYPPGKLKERFTDMGEESTGHDIIRRLQNTTKIVLLWSWWLRWLHDWNTFHFSIR